MHAGTKDSVLPLRPTVTVMADKIATRDEILGLLTAAARRGHVPAIRLLLDELRREEAVSSGVIDELASKRTKASRIG